MKAAQINDYGSAEAVKINEVDHPAPKDGQVLVEVHAASVNPFDSKLRDGLMKDSITLTLPVTLGGDLAGVIVAVGGGVEDFSVGDKVYGQASVVAGNSGAFAEYAVTSATQLGMMPSKLSYAEAAALPLVGVSAWQALVKHIGLQAGQRLFIHGGAGGIGSVAIQIAKRLEAYVATTATEDGIDFVKGLGADEVVDYKSVDFALVLQDYDAVYDTVGGEDFERSLGILKPGGIAVSMTAAADEAKVNELDVQAITQSTKVNTEALNQLRELVEAGAISPQVEKTFPLEQIKEAFEARESGKTKGKVVLAIR